MGTVVQICHFALTRSDSVYIYTYFYDLFFFLFFFFYYFLIAKLQTDSENSENINQMRTTALTPA